MNREKKLDIEHGISLVNMAEYIGPSILFVPFALWQPVPYFSSCCCCCFGNLSVIHFSCLCENYKTRCFCSFGKLIWHERKEAEEGVKGKGQKCARSKQVSHSSLSLCLRIINEIVVVAVVATCRLSLVCCLPELKSYL